MTDEDARTKYSEKKEKKDIFMTAYAVGHHN